MVLDVGSKCECSIKSFAGGWLMAWIVCIVL